MVAKKGKKAGRKVKSLAVRNLSAKRAKDVRGGLPPEVPMKGTTKKWG
jgi:hypothetical protein